MGLYSRFVFPRLCNLLLNKPMVAERRRGLLARAEGEVLEIGFGSGLNLPHYPRAVRKLTTVDPSPGMHALARERIKKSGIEVDQRLLRGEELPFANDTFDVVVSTFTLCSIAKVDQAVAEAFRVLRPGGRFLFLEHGLSPDAGVRKWQNRLCRLQMWLGDGCRLNRDIHALVAAQPFASLRIDQSYMTTLPKTHGYLYEGVGCK